VTGILPPLAVIVISFTPVTISLSRQVLHCGFATVQDDIA